MTPVPLRPIQAICVARIRLVFFPPLLAGLLHTRVSETAEKVCRSCERLEKGCVISSRRTTHECSSRTLFELANRHRAYVQSTVSYACLFHVDDHDAVIYIYVQQLISAAIKHHAEVARDHSRAVSPPDCIFLSRPKKLLYWGSSLVKHARRCGWAAAPSLVRSSRLMFENSSPPCHQLLSPGALGTDLNHTLRHTQQPFFLLSQSPFSCHFFSFLAARTTYTVYAKPTHALKEAQVCFPCSL